MSNIKSFCKKNKKVMNNLNKQFNNKINLK